MALTERETEDKIEVIGDFNILQIRTATVIERDGEEISRSFHRHVCSPDQDVSGESTEVQSIATAVWTDEIKAAWAAHQAEQEI
jgi:hypothetical protein